MYYYLNKYNELVCTVDRKVLDDKDIHVLGTIDESDFYDLVNKTTDIDGSIVKVITIDENNKIVLADKPFKPILPRTENDYWLELSFNERNSIDFLCRKLQYFYIDDDMSKGIDLDRPLFSYTNIDYKGNKCLFTVDTARDYVNLHQYDDDEHMTKSKDLSNQIITAKKYIRDHIVEL